MGKAGENQISRRERFPSSMPMLVPMVMVMGVIVVIMIVMAVIMVAVIVMAVIVTSMGMRALVVGPAFGVKRRLHLDHFGA